jgi:hypothetical protein
MSLDPDLGQIGVYRTQTLSYLFELALYISAKDRVRAELTYAKLLNSADLTPSKYDDISTIDGDSCCDMPPLVPLSQSTPIELRISEINGAVPTGGLFDEITKPSSVPIDDDDGNFEEDEDELVDKNKQKTLRKRELLGSQASSTVVSEDEEEEVAGEEEEEEAAEEEEEAAEEEVAEEEEEEVAEEEEEEVAEEEEEEVAEEEEVELDLEPVRIKKTIYWKDVNSGDIYDMLPEDEVGDRVGKYIDGKPIFGPGL